MNFSFEKPGRGVLITCKSSQNDNVQHAIWYESLHKWGRSRCIKFENEWISPKEFQKAAGNCSNDYFKAFKVGGKGILTTGDTYRKGTNVYSFKNIQKKQFKSRSYNLKNSEKTTYFCGDCDFFCNFKTDIENHEIKEHQKEKDNTNIGLEDENQEDGNQEKEDNTNIGLEDPLKVLLHKCPLCKYVSVLKNEVSSHID